MQTTTTTRPRPGALLAVLLTAPFLAQADATIANVATPAIQSGLGASAAAVELVVGDSLISFAVLLITGARPDGVLMGPTHNPRSCATSSADTTRLRPASRSSSRWAATAPSSRSISDS